MIQYPRKCLNQFRPVRARRPVTVSCGGRHKFVASSTVKKVVVRRFDRETLTGFVNPLSYLQPQMIELLTPEGSLLTLSYNEVKSVCFVKDFEAEEESRKVFLTRPKLAGLWVRMVFRDSGTAGRHSAQRSSRLGDCRVYGYASGARCQQPAGLCAAPGVKDDSGPGGCGQPAANQDTEEGARTRSANVVLSNHRLKSVKS